MGEKAGRKRRRSKRINGQIERRTERKLHPGDNVKSSVLFLKKRKMKKKKDEKSEVVGVVEEINKNTKGNKWENVNIFK